MSWDDVKISQMVSQMRRSHKWFPKMMKKISTTSVVGSSVLLGKDEYVWLAKERPLQESQYCSITSCKLKLLDLNHKHRVWDPTYLSTIPFAISYQLQNTYPLMPSFRASFLFPTLEHGALIWIPPPRKLVSYLRFLSFIPQHRYLMIHLRNQNSFQLQSLYQDQLQLLQLLSCPRLEGRSYDANTGPCRFLRQ